MALTFGAAGRWNTKGRVYVMAQKKNGRTQYKIGSSKNPRKRLNQIRKSEGNNKIRLISNLQAKRRMRNAEAAGQMAAKRIGLKKDKTRGGATDWFKNGRRSRVRQKTVARAVRQAVRGHNAGHF